MGTASVPRRVGRSPQQKRAKLTSTLAFFIMGLSVVLSFDRGWGLASYAWVTIPAGLAVGIVILFAGRKMIRAG